MPKKPMLYWARGAILAPAVAIVLLFAGEIAVVLGPFGRILTTILLAPVYPTIWLAERLINPKLDIPVILLTYLIIGLVYCCLIGGVVGFIYGKIKNRNRTATS